MRNIPAILFKLKRWHLHCLQEGSTMWNASRVQSWSDCMDFPLFHGLKVDESGKSTPTCFYWPLLFCSCGGCWKTSELPCEDPFRWSSPCCHSFWLIYMVLRCSFSSQWGKILSSVQMCSPGKVKGIIWVEFIPSFIIVVVSAVCFWDEILNLLLL